ncbi:EAL domain-containing response regulator [Pseudomonas sp. 5P_3.1_Bac2]|uniref:EAL domain-containing response regulator n=1 Tax=Pseudomonas sp. 5P_3.1_Bac2 TaxID=2971617 RepID=UPI0021C86D09|nr:EAL domain-containing response regulator [Pseudomonas sp. 5P_3.1_Bac2]MCU1717102.1 EAL domain-containing response regulator [Pseudomonas sp. 5P_3.1_Bac2]
MNKLGYRVLVVEDQPFQREHLLHLLREQGLMQLTWAEDGLQAICHLEREVFDLVFSDLMLPQVDGVQLIQHLAQLEQRPQLVLMSSSTQQVLTSASIVARSLGLPLLGKLPKPVQAKDLADLLKQIDLPPRPPAPALTSVTEEELRQAIASGQLTAWFQPKKSLQHNRIVAAEALLRWVKPSGEVLLPGMFLSVIEHAGLDELLLLSVTRQVLLAQQLWQTEMGLAIPVSINLPTHLLDDAGLPDRLLQLVQELRGDPAAICFELTENSTARNPVNYYAGTCRLRMMGFGLAQDDFGQGYSSLYQLLSTPFSELKIDRTLLQGCIDDAHKTSALQSIIQLGHQLGLTVIAEGVETQAELDLLNQLGCDHIQGFLIGEALNTQAFGQTFALAQA